MKNEQEKQTFTEVLPKKNGELQAINREVAIQQILGVFRKLMIFCQGMAFLQKPVKNYLMIIG